jgi:hypothetical protein
MFLYLQRRGSPPRCGERCVLFSRRQSRNPRLRRGLDSSCPSYFSLSRLIVTYLKQGENIYRLKYVNLRYCIYSTYGLKQIAPTHRYQIDPHGSIPRRKRFASKTARKLERQENERGTIQDRTYDRKAPTVLFS